MYVGQMRCTWLPQPGASLWWVPLQGVDNQGYGTHQPESQAAIFTGCATPVRVVAGVPPVDPQVNIIRGKEDTSKLIGYWPLTWSAGMVYIWGVGAAQGHGDVELIPCFCTILGEWCGGSAAYMVGTWGR